MTLYQEEGLQGHDNTTKEKERIEKRRKVCIIRTRGSIVGTGESIDVNPQAIKLSSNVCRKQVFS